MKSTAEAAILGALANRRHWLPSLLRTMACAASVSIAPGVDAMQLTRAGDALVLSGEIVFQDLERVKKALDAVPETRTIVLRNSMGGNSWTGYRLGELFRERGLTTVVSGHCVSSCSRLFLGGRDRLFSDDFPASLTYVGFHGHYDFGELNAEAVRKNDLIAWTLKHAGTTLDRKLVQRWATIPKRAGDVRFYPPMANDSFSSVTFYCAGNESRRPQRCERLSTHAHAQGIVTSEQIYRSADRDQLPFGARERAVPTTTFATLARPPAAALAFPRFAAAQRAFRDGALPRALAVTPDFRGAEWRGNSQRANEDALAACERAAKRRCMLYAVDERVVFR